MPKSPQAAAQPQEEIGAVHDVSCPVLSKIGEAFAYAKLVAYRTGPHALGTGSRTIEGKDGARVELAWIATCQTLVLAFEGPIHDKAKEYLAPVYESRRTPPYLANVAPDAEVHAGFLDVLDSFLEATSGAMGMGDVVREISGHTPPRRILLTGWCMGGSLATIAAPWAALQCPTADVRCITFGAPLSGNAAFVEVFRWLIGVSYRLVYAKDPMPEKGGGMLGSFVPVRGSMYLTSNADYTPGTAPGVFGRDVKDHQLTRYAQALKAAINRYHEAENEAPVCSADPDGCRVEVKKPTFDAWMAASGDSAVNMMKTYFYGEQKGSRRQMWVSEFNKSTARDEKMAEAAAEACRDPGPMPMAGASPERGTSPSRAASDPKLHTSGAPANGAANGEARENGGQDAPKMNDEAESSAAKRAGEAYGKVVEEATAGINTGLAAGDGAPAFLVRAFSLAEREDALLDLEHLTTLEKVLVMGKVSQAVVVAGAAYRDEAAFAKITGITNVKMIDDKGKTDVQVHVGWLDNGTAVFAFRGTESAQDGLQDAKFLRRGIDYLEKAYPGVKAHLGFLQQFSAVVNPDIPDLNLGAVLKQLSGGKMPNRVLCTGHSLGGALATLGATWAALEYPNADVRCITFGSPRVGNHKFRSAFHSLVACSLRVVYGADPVPLMPPSNSWWLRYYHVKGAMHVNRNTVVLRSRPWHYAWRPNVADHWVARYTHGLYTIVPGGTAMMPKFEDDDTTASGNSRKGSRRRRFDDDGAASKAPTGCFGRLDPESSDSEEASSPTAQAHDGAETWNGGAEAQVPATGPPLRKKFAQMLSIKTHKSQNKNGGAADFGQSKNGGAAESSKARSPGSGRPTSPTLASSFGRLFSGRPRTSAEPVVNPLGSSGPSVPVAG